MLSAIDSPQRVNNNAMPTPGSLEQGAKPITAEKVGPAAVTKISTGGHSAVENAQIAAEQSYSAMAAATSGGGTDVTVEFMLEQNGKSLG